MEDLPVDQYVALNKESSFNVNEMRIMMTGISFLAATVCLSVAVIVGTGPQAESKLLSAYISDSPSSSLPAWTSIGRSGAISTEAIGSFSIDQNLF